MSATGGKECFVAPLGLDGSKGGPSAEAAIVAQRHQLLRRIRPPPVHHIGSTGYLQEGQTHLHQFRTIPQMLVVGMLSSLL
jgi:hypothetical protein